MSKGKFIYGVKQLKKTIRDIPVESRHTLVRVDYNVPVDEGVVKDDTRIRYSLPTLQYLLERGARVILLSHLGRPKGQVKEELRLDPVAERLSSLLGRQVQKLDSVTGEEVKKTAASLEDGEVLLLENLRFHPGEEKNDPDLAGELAGLGDLYVNDAFGTAHRAHASTEGITRFLPAVAGLLMEKEINTLQSCLDNPSRPLTVVLGGAKVSDKIGVIKRFLETADRLLIGGGMANTFLAAQGYSLGASFYEKDSLEEARELLELFARGETEVYLPRDLVVVQEIKANAPNRQVEVDSIPEDWKAVDVGTSTVKEFGRVARESRLLVWNGPLGVFETSPFHQGTEGVARAATEGQAYLLLGGGDTVAAFEQLGLIERVNYASTGGGATLEFWEGRELPGITALEDKD